MGGEDCFDDAFGVPCLVDGFDPLMMLIVSAALSALGCAINSCFDAQSGCGFC